MVNVPKVYVGIDYHQEFCTLCVMAPDGAVLFRQNAFPSIEFVQKLFAWMCPGPLEIHAAIEVCGGAAQFADKLRKHGWRVDLAHAGYVSRLKRGQDKTDKQDAELLADLVRVGYLPKVWLAPERLRELRSLIHYRQQLAEAKRKERLRLRALMREAGLKLSGRAWTLPWLEKLRNSLEQLGGLRSWIAEKHLAESQRFTKAIKEVESHLAEQVKDDPTYKKLIVEPGVGLVTAATLLAEIGDFRRFARGKQLARYCGTAPVNDSTGGVSKELGLGRACNRELRRVIVEAAHRLARCVPRWKDHKQRLVDAGKPKSVAAIAVANRWIRHLHHRMTHEEPITQVA